MKKVVLCLVFALSIPVAYWLGLASRIHPSGVLEVPRAKAGECVSPHPHTAFVSKWSSVLAGICIDGQISIEQTETVPDNAILNSLLATAGIAPGRHSRTDVYTPSFKPVQITSRHGSELYVLGHPFLSREEGTYDGTVSLIERWVIGETTGAPSYDREVGTAPLGTALPLSNLTARLVGAVYVPAEVRAPQEIERTLMFAVPFPVTSIAIDPQGRYILALSADKGALYLLNLLDRSAAPQAILQSSRYPGLSQATGLDKGRWSIDGYKRYLISLGDGATLMIVDPENDGVFGSRPLVTEVSEEDWYSNDYGAPSNWEENYVTYGAFRFF